MNSLFCMFVNRITLLHSSVTSFRSTCMLITHPCGFMELHFILTAEYVSQYECANDAIAYIIEICISVGQEFSNFGVPKIHLGRLLKKKMFRESIRNSDSVGLGQGGRICILIKLLSDTEANCCVHTLRSKAVGGTYHFLIYLKEFFMKSGY